MGGWPVLDAFQGRVSWFVFRCGKDWKVSARADTRIRSQGKRESGIRQTCAGRNSCARSRSGIPFAQSAEFRSCKVYLGTNCAASVEPSRAVGEDVPPATPCCTASKYPVPTK